MAYNIDKWKTKKIENLVLPNLVLQLKTKRGKSLFVIDKFDLETNEIECYSEECECVEIKGTIDIEKNLRVTHFRIYGEGSGWFMGDYKDKIFSQSTGFLEAMLVWEGGDTVEMFRVKDGVIEEEKL